MRATVPCLFCAALTLGACSKTPASTTAAAPPAGPAPAVAALARPHPKPGLWEMAISTEMGPGGHMTGQICIDEATQEAAFQAGPRRAAGRECAAPQFRSAAGGFAFDTSCKMRDGRTVNSHAVVTGDFSSAYQMEMTSTTTPPLPGGIGGGHALVKARWLGPCPPGAKAGQMSMKFGGLGQG